VKGQDWEFARLAPFGIPAQRFQVQATVNGGMRVPAADALARANSCRDETLRMKSQPSIDLLPGPSRHNFRLHCFVRERPALEPASSNRCLTRSRAGCEGTPPRKLTSIARAVSAFRATVEVCWPKKIQLFDLESGYLGNPYQCFAEPTPGSRFPNLG